MKTYFFLAIFSFLLIIAAVFGCNNDDDGSEESRPDPGSQQQWMVLHGNQARTDSVDTTGVTGNPTILFNIEDEEPAAFNGPVIGPVDKSEFGVPYLLYREIGPGPLGGFSPPPEIESVFGTKMAIEAIHPFTGEVLASHELNEGAAQNFAAVDSHGDVWVGDTGRISHFSAGLKEVIKRIDLSETVGSTFPASAVAGTPMFLSDGNLVAPFLGGQIILLDRDSGEILDMIELDNLDPPVAEDPQIGSLGGYLRNAVAADGDVGFYLVYGEIIRIDYDATAKKLIIIERTEIDGFSSSTPTLDVVQKRMWMVMMDPEDFAAAPKLTCYNYATAPVELRWEVPTSVAFAESEDQLTNTYVASADLIINNAFFGPIEAYRETADGKSAEIVWTTADTVSPDFMAYIASGSEQDGMLYVLDNREPKLYGLDAATGEIKWELDVPGQSVKKPIPYNGIVYFDHIRGLLAITEGR
jgi:PQQ-like domain